MRGSWVGVIGWLAACNPAPEVTDPPGGTASVRVTGDEFSFREGEPLAQQLVGFVAPDGYTTVVYTDADGVAVGPAEAGTTIHVVVPREDPTAYSRVYSILDVSPGDFIAVGSLPPGQPPAGNIDITIPSSPAQTALEWLHEIPCQVTPYLASTRVTLTVSTGCADEVGTVVVTARDQTSFDIVAFLVVPDVAFEPGTNVTTSSSWQPGVEYAASHAGFPADAAVDVSWWVRGVYHRPVPILLRGDSNAGVVMDADQPLTGEHYVISRDHSVRQLVVEPGDGTRQHQLEGEGMLPTISEPSFDNDARVFRWTTTDATAHVDVVHVLAELRRSDDADWWIWNLYAPGDRRELALPDLPDEIVVGDEGLQGTCCYPDIALVDFDDGTYGEVLRGIDIYLPYVQQGWYAPLDQYDIALPATRWRSTGAGLPSSAR